MGEIVADPLAVLDRELERVRKDMIRLEGIREGLLMAYEIMSRDLDEPEAE